jgi:hypothetical protein
MFYFLLDWFSYPLEHLKSTSQLQGYFIGLHFALFGHPLKFCSFIHGKSTPTAHFPYHNALFYKSSCVLKHYPTCKACCWTQFRYFVIWWKGREGNSICLGCFSFYFLSFFNILSNKCISWYNIPNTYKNSYMFWHSGAIFRELVRQRYMIQPVNLCFVHGCKLN